MSFSPLSSSLFSVHSDHYGALSSSATSGSTFAVTMDREEGSDRWGRGYAYQGPLLTALPLPQGHILRIRISSLSVSGLDGTIRPFFMVGIGPESNDATQLDYPINRGVGAGVSWREDGSIRLVSGDGQFAPRDAVVWGSEDYAASLVKDVEGKFWSRPGRYSSLVLVGGHDTSDNPLDAAKFHSNIFDTTPTRIWVSLGNEVPGTAGLYTVSGSLSYEVYDAIT